VGATKSFFSFLLFLTGIGRTNPTVTTDARLRQSEMDAEKQFFPFFKLRKTDQPLEGE
jgi:hypothetical protein